MVGSVADSSTSGGSFWFERHEKKHNVQNW
jgi:hypothetical protein